MIFLTLLNEEIQVNSSKCTQDNTYSGRTYVPILESTLKKNAAIRRTRSTEFLRLINLFWETKLATLDPYSILGIPKGSTSSVIRAAYTRLIIQHHPDKQQQQQQQQQQQKHLSGLTISNELTISDDSLQSTLSLSSSFLEIQAAWEALRDDPMIITGSDATSSTLIKQKQRRSVAILETVSLDDLHINSEKSDEYIYNCRCGGECLLQENDIERAKNNNEGLTVQCPNCSLAYKVVH